MAVRIHSKIQNQPVEMIDEEDVMAWARQFRDVDSLEDAMTLLEDIGEARFVWPGGRRDNPGIPQDEIIRRGDTVRLAKDSADSPYFGKVLAIYGTRRKDKKALVSWWTWFEHGLVATGREEVPVTDLVHQVVKHGGKEMGLERGSIQHLEALWLYAVAEHKKALDRLKEVIVRKEAGEVSKGVYERALQEYNAAKEAKYFAWSRFEMAMKEQAGHREENPSRQRDLQRIWWRACLAHSTAVKRLDEIEHRMEFQPIGQQLYDLAIEEVDRTKAEREQARQDYNMALRERGELGEIEDNTILGLHALAHFFGPAVIGKASKNPNYTAGQLLHVCQHCGKVTKDRTEPVPPELEDELVSHGICPECLEKYYPEDAKEIRRRGHRVR